MERHGWTFLVLEEGTGPRASLMRRVAGLLPEEEGRATVLLDEGIRLDAAVGALREVARTALSAGRGCLRMALAGSGSPNGRRPSAAQRLTERLGIQVLAPDGSVVVLPDGSLFLVHPDGPMSGAGRWVRFSEGRVTGEESPWFPQPSWARWGTDVPDGAHGVRAVAVPAGWLLCHDPGLPHPAVSPEDLAFAVPADDTWCTVIVGRPGQPPVPDEAVTGWMGALDPRLRQRAALVAWGPQPRRPNGIGRLSAVARGLGEEASAWTGLPLLDGDGVRYVVVCDSAGRPSWRPPARRLRCLPGERPTVTSWTPLPESFPPSAEAIPGRPTFRTESDWRVEIVPQGLWVRPPLVCDPDLPAGVLGSEPDPDRAFLLVGAEGHPLPRTTWPTVNSLLGVLEPEVRERLWMVVLGQVAPAVLSAGATLADRWKVRWVGPGDSSDALPGTEPLPLGEIHLARGTGTVRDRPEGGPAPVPGTTTVVSREPVPSRDSDVTAQPAPPARGGPAWLNGHRTADDDARTALKSLLGPALDLMTVAVALSGPPCDGQAQALPTIDHVALRAWLTGWQVDARHLDEWLREGGAAEHRGYALCVASALEHLPRYEGLAVRPAPRDTDLGGLSPGQVLREPGFVLACPGPVDWSEPVGAEYVLWCRSARRIDRLPDRTPGPVVALTAGTSFRVLRVETEGRVFLEELPAGGERDATVLDRLLEALARTPVARTPPAHPGTDLPIGTDSTGSPHV